MVIRHFLIWFSLKVSFIYLIGNLVVGSVIFHVSSVIPIYTPTALFGLDDGTIVKMHVDREVDVCVNGNTESACHCSKR